MFPRLTDSSSLGGSSLILGVSRIAWKSSDGRVCWTKAGVAPLELEPKRDDVGVSLGVVEDMALKDHPCVVDGACGVVVSVFGSPKRPKTGAAGVALDWLMVAGGVVVGRSCDLVSNDAGPC